MNYKIPGLLSIIIMSIAIIMADIKLFLISIPIGIVYTILTPFLFFVVLFFYCRKCPHTVNGTCRHVIFGKITKNLFGISDYDKYTVKEIVFTLLALLFLVAFPQYWLLKSPVFFTAFWILMLISIIIIRTGVCPGCRNINCVFCPNAINPES